MNPSFIFHIPLARHVPVVSCFIALLYSVLQLQKKKPDINVVLLYPLLYLNKFMIRSYYGDIQYTYKLSWDEMVLVFPDLGHQSNPIWMQCCHFILIWVLCALLDGTQDYKTECWKNVVNVVVLSAAGMISNHLLFKVSSLV